MREDHAPRLAAILRDAKEIADLLRCAVPTETLENFDHAAGILQRFAEYGGAGVGQVVVKLRFPAPADEPDPPSAPKSPYFFERLDTFNNQQAAAAHVSESAPKVAFLPSE